MVVVIVPPNTSGGYNSFPPSNYDTMKGGSYNVITCKNSFLFNLI